MPVDYCFHGPNWSHLWQCGSHLGCTNYVRSRHAFLSSSVHVLVLIPSSISVSGLQQMATSMNSYKRSQGKGRLRSIVYDPEERERKQDRLLKMRKSPNERMNHFKQTKECVEFINEKLERQQQRRHHQQSWGQLMASLTRQACLADHGVTRSNWEHLKQTDAATACECSTDSWSL